MKEDEWKLEVHTICIMETVAVRARHVTPVISVYCIIVAEPYFAGFRSAY
jgi:hypothetical protein